jgi:hypothetical protein
MSVESNNNLEKASIEYEMVYADPTDIRGPMDLGDQIMPENPVQAFLASRIDELSKANKSSVDLAEIIGPLSTEEPLAKTASSVDPAWDEPIGSPRIQLSEDFVKRSSARLNRVAEKIRKVFGPQHTEETEEAIALAQSMRDDVREEVLVLAGQ